ncbi:hypothetical protein F5Y18DRAFT_419261 [Xylariaceae sp. FL1019]|nr:hypothetical protein F5Y18DRAFT_419261 [Xylariaceae sp. FL1019]
MDEVHKIIGMILHSVDISIKDSIPARSSILITPGISPQVPTRTSSKRRSEITDNEYRMLHFKAEEARKKIKPSHSFDANYWLSAASASQISFKLYETEGRLSREKWAGDDDSNDPKDWWATPEAHQIVDKMKAAHHEKGGHIRRAFQTLFNTSQIGLGVDKAGMGKRTRSEQSKFKASLIKFYDAASTNPKKPKVIMSIHDTSTGQEEKKDLIRAAHLVPHSFDEDLLVAIFGGNVKGELNTPHNGLLLSIEVEKAMDDGAIAAVPDIADDPSTEEVETWERTEPKNYKWRVMDPEAEVLDVAVVVPSPSCPDGLLVRQLHGRQLSFKNGNCPRARYLYFLFVVAQLRQAWRHDFRRDSSKVLKNQVGKGFWATKGRYLRRGFLLSMAEEIGHDTDFKENIPMMPSDDDDDDETGDAGVIGIAKMFQYGANDEDEDEEDEEDEEE